ncbi:peptidase M42 [Luteolibacter algae]|uniref:Peptidase M42 n=1 Tax=Luteolibacter algae TaxID=454151 RepID=A0ABW5D8E7_9BACT
MYPSPTADLSGFLITLRHLIREPAVVGAEDSFFRVLRRELEELDISVERHSGILVARGNNPDGVILSAHIDRNGLVCTGPNEFQYAAFIAANRSELTGDSISEQMVATIADRFTGQRVQAHLPYTGTYIGQSVITSGYLCPKRLNLIFEVEGLDHLEPGTPISFLDRLKLTNTHISAQLDNVLSVALIIYLYRIGFQGTALFTAQEEAGRSWRYALEWLRRESITTHRLLVLDTSPYPTLEEAAAQDLVLRRKDATCTFDPKFTDEIAHRCDELGIKYSYKDEWIEERNQHKEKASSLGRTELGRLAYASDGEINGTTLQIPTTGYHTAEETASLSSVQAAIGLLCTFIR